MDDDVSSCHYTLSQNLRLEIQNAGRIGLMVGVFVRVIGYSMKTFRSVSIKLGMIKP